MNNNWKCLLLLCCILAFFNYTKASSVINLTDDISSYLISKNDILIFEDASNEVGIAEVKSLPDSKFTHSSFVTTEPYATYWVKFNVNTETLSNNKWILEVLDSRHYLVELYIPQKNGEYKIISTGLKYPFEKRHYLHKNFVIDLNFPEEKSNELYLKIQSHVVGSMIFKLRTNNEFSSYAFNEYYMLGIYYGILAVILLFNFILFYSLKENIYLTYGCYILIWAWTSMLDDGIGYQYIWSNAPGISQLGFVAGRLTLLIMFVYYSRQFLANDKAILKYDKWVNYSVGFYAFNYILSHFIHYPSIVLSVIFLLPIVLIYITSIQIYKEGYKPARFFIIGNTFILSGFILRMISDLNMIEFPPAMAIIFNYGQNIGIVLEICTLFIALGDRFRFMKIQKELANQKIIAQLKENEILSQKVNKELEEKVDERTKELLAKTEELKELNNKLEQQAIEISKWNQLLDIDNHNLKKKVKEEIEARIKLEDVSYERFLEIFPDELACQRYIDEIKWKDGFTCKKCNNPKFCNGSKLFSRRCTKCGYNESVTAYTFLHKCKFSLVKAFYIMMKVNKYGDEVNCAELARELEMRNATVWEFKNKILECKEDKHIGLDLLILQNLNN